MLITMCFPRDQNFPLSNSLFLDFQCKIIHNGLEGAVEKKKEKKEDKKMKKYNSGTFPLCFYVNMLD